MNDVVGFLLFVASSAGIFIFSAGILELRDIRRIERDGGEVEAGARRRAYAFIVAGGILGGTTMIGALAAFGTAVFDLLSD